MRPEWFVFIGIVLSLIVGLLISIAGKLGAIHKILDERLSND